MLMALQCADDHRASRGCRRWCWPLPSRSQLVSAKTPDTSVIADHLSEAASNLHNKPVADGMSQTVVNGTEAVKVEK